MQCKTVLTCIDAFRTDELPVIEKTAVAQHLKTCRSCGASSNDVDELASVVKTLTIVPERSCRDACMETITDSYDLVDTGAGTVLVAFASGGIRYITTDTAIDDVRPIYAKRYRRALQRSAIAEPLRRQVVAAVRGEGVDAPKVDLAESRDLEHDVLQMLTKIPRGEVRTYAWVARQVGRPRAVRAVGNIVARNMTPFLLPCHRVVPASGGIGNYIFGPEMKRTMLEREGVDVANLETLARDHVRYIGSRTTHIFCFPTCKDARRIREENRVPFRDADDALETGYRPCRRCQPVAA
jgi:O-6-methylguanine DNA methyltransferase